MTDTDVAEAVAKAKDQVKQVEDTAFEIFVEETLYEKAKDIKSWEDSITRTKESMNKEALKNGFAMNKGKYIFKAELELGFRDENKRY